MLCRSVAGLVLQSQLARAEPCKKQITSGRIAQFTSLGKRTMTQRRTFLKQLAFAGIGGTALLKTGRLSAAVDAAEAAEAAKFPEMTYRVLGRTGYNASRLVYGCGAALSRNRADRVLNLAFEQGVNVYDVGTSSYYNDAQRNLADFAGTHRDDIFLITKDFVSGADADSDPNLEESKKIAADWESKLDTCLTDLNQEHVDAYYIMGANNPRIVNNEEIFNSFERAKAAGKVSHLGFSSHENASECLAAAVDSGKYSLAMLAMTPAGWYDWASKNTLKNTKSLKELQPELQGARESGIGLIAMKAGRMLAPRMWGGRGNQDAFDAQYGDKLLKANLSSFQRSYAYVLENGFDVVNADIQNFHILAENFTAAATSSHYA